MRGLSKGACWQAWQPEFSLWGGTWRKQRTKFCKLFSVLQTRSVAHSCMYIHEINKCQKEKKRWPVLFWVILCSTEEARLCTLVLPHERVCGWLSIEGGGGDGRWSATMNVTYSDPSPGREIEIKTPEYTQNEQSKTYLPLFCVLYHWAIWLKQISRTRSEVTFLWGDEINEKNQGWVNVLWILRGENSFSWIRRGFFFDLVVSKIITFLF